MTAGIEHPTLSANLEALFASGRPVFLAFSGGKDSVAVAHLCEPWRDRLTLLWVHARGYMAPHMVDFVRGYSERFRVVEIEAPDLFTLWRDAGVPVDILPVRRVFGAGGVAPTDKLIAWPACCFAVRNKPLWDFAATLTEPSVILHGHHASDLGGTTPGMQAQCPPHVEVVGPIWEWSDADVTGFLEREGVTLPAQYPELPGSLECLPCPAGGMTPRRLAYLDREFPDAARIVRAGIGHELAIIADEVARRAEILRA